MTEIICKYNRERSPRLVGMQERFMKTTNILRKHAVLKKISVSSATLWRLCKSGNFPKPIKIGENSVGWLEEEIFEWLDQKKVERDEGACNA